MQLKLAATIAALTLAGFASQSAMASDGKVNFEGKVAQTTCTNKGENYVNLGVLNLGDATMTDKGTKGLANRFYLKLENCTDFASKNATVKFTGSAVDGDPKLLVNATGAEFATRVGVEIADDNGKQILGVDSKQFTLLGVSNKLLFDARFVRTAETATPMTAGKVVAIAEFDITYQ
ncbi:fimbrial protein [Glaciimonas immobilis]|uniref:Type 1 fimbria pilin n=1 Tax=Glaciimonas immobilis TaxID=728004 RepID=A0A840RUK2_9BURK|nr:fimbrial protein [Glaciimonas immobilis]KAF3997222.1 type 1 fimbrial protein [Glaciimonas immobilis]MBB5202267.1 type 1 fimbria pilin [Glaciimonas immobilis]